MVDKIVNLKKKYPSLDFSNEELHRFGADTFSKGLSLAADEQEVTGLRLSKKDWFFYFVVVPCLLCYYLGLFLFIVACFSWRLELLTGSIGLLAVSAIFADWHKKSKKDGGF
jgi:hypothetical protein